MIQGDVTTFLAALGASEGDARLERALALVGGDYDVEVYDDDDVQSKYLIMADRGADFLLKDGSLSTVFFYAVESADEHVYVGEATLIDGVSFAMSRDELFEQIGQPKRATAGYAIYAVGEGFVQFDFDKDSIKQVNVMAQDFGG